MIIGIDPGCSGCIVVLNNSLEYWGHLSMPVVKSGKSNRVNGAAVAEFIGSITKDVKTHVYLEKVGAMPKQGVTSTFTFGHSAGVVEGVIQGLGLPYTLVTPQAWKKRAGLIGQDKDAARSRAIQLYPGLRALDAIGKGQALADAMLIARFGRESLL